MQRNSNWSRERRTALELVCVWASTFRSKAKAAEAIQLDDGVMEPGHLRIWMLQSHRRFDPATARSVALAVGIPLEAVLFKNERICDLVCEKARRAA